MYRGSGHGGGGGAHATRGQSTMELDWRKEIAMSRIMRAAWPVICCTRVLVTVSEE